jgi:hypothetical protein
MSIIFNFYKIKYLIFIKKVLFEILMTIEFINLKNKLHDFQPATRNISLLPSIIKHLCMFNNL